MQVQNFSKIRSKIFEKYFFENMASFSCRGCQALSSYMRIDCYSTVNNERCRNFYANT